MALSAPPPPLLTGESDTTFSTAYNNGGTASNDIVSQQLQQQHSSSSSTSTSSSIIIVIIVIASAIIISASIYLLLRFLTRRCSRSVRSISSGDNVVSDRRNENEAHHQVICFDDRNKVESLPLFTFSSLTGNIAGGDCAVCLSRFEAVDRLRLLPLCCHAFHVECIDAWLKSNQTCPLCRSTVNPSETDVLNKILSVSDNSGGGGRGGDRNDSFRIEIGSISRRRTPSDLAQRSYSIGAYEYVLDDGYEVSVESTHRREISDCTSVDKESGTLEPPVENSIAAIAAAAGGGGGSGRLNWLRDYVDRVSFSISSRSQSFRGSGRFFTGSSRRSEAVDDFEATHGRVGEEISELFRWLSGV